MAFIAGVVLGFIVGWAIKWYLTNDAESTELEACREKMSKAQFEIVSLKDLLDKAERAKSEPEPHGQTVGEGAETADDLKKIEGIGPKIAGLLAKGGITTFAQLAQANGDRLQRILDDAGSRYRIADPSTWPQQAQLAAKDDWSGLKELQKRLKGGKGAG